MAVGGIPVRVISTDGGIKPICARRGARDCALSKHLAARNNCEFWRIADTTRKRKLRLSDDEGRTVRILSDLFAVHLRSHELTASFGGHPSPEQ